MAKTKQKKVKPNPRNRPATWADVEKAYKAGESKGQTDGLNLSMVIFLTVLVDKFNGADYIKDVWREVTYLSESISKDYVNFWDLKTTLEQEYDIVVGDTKK